jgi:hypothetical protein
MSEDRLRDALTARADAVEVEPDALPKIRARTSRGGRRRWLPIAGIAVATAAVVAIAAVAFVPRHHAPTTPIATSASAEIDDTADPSASADLDVPPLPTPTPQFGTLIAGVPVYYVGGGHLFREYHDVKVTPDTVVGRITAAVTEMMRAKSPADPDYTTLWPIGITVRQVTLVDGIATVDLSSAGTAPRGDAGLAVQELVWTVAAAVVDTPVAQVTGVRLTIAGVPVPTIWGTVDTSGILHQGPATDVLPPLWLIEPHQGAIVGQKVTVHISGSVFEATARLRVRATPGGNVVKDQKVMLDKGAPARGETTLTIQLSPGKYAVEVYFVSAKDGTEQGLDDHAVTVR